MNQKLLKELELNDIELIELPLVGKLKGLYADNVIVIDKKIDTNSEKNCILAEEIGHYHTNFGDILDQSDIRNRKQERKARAWAYEQLVGVKDLIRAFKYGVKNRYELAEYLNVTEEFIEDVLIYYLQKYGLQYQMDNYLISFDPLSILEVWE